VRSRLLHHKTNSRTLAWDRRKAFRASGQILCAELRPSDKQKACCALGKGTVLLACEFERVYLYLHQRRTILGIRILTCDRKVF
jgi:hypothetical protein